MSLQSVVIVAGGSGSRMNSALPKQFLGIHGKPVIVHTIGVFYDFDPTIELVVVLPEVHLATWHQIQQQFFKTSNIKTAIGGTSRFQSVKAGLEQVTGELVAIHDAVRPCVSVEVIGQSFASARLHGSGLVTVPMKDSIREVDGQSSIARDRSRFHIVQTPQTFQTALIKEAFLQSERDSFTDDASVYEASGFQVHIVAGSYENIKITTPEDLAIAAIFLSKSPQRA